MDWKVTMLEENVSEAFIKDYNHKVDWDYIVKTEALTETWMEYFAPYLSWGSFHYIKRCQRSLWKNIKVFFIGVGLLPIKA